ncbi:carbon-nitrogen hydrolase family protein [Aeromicrobium sp.]|uniref:carbon-nitrogen hydrolase family protein n=1 Tax=Aeromicrobium sp. TaxID=1871063 RepID=UPI0028AFE7A6|nr:carbon-nitrogen hydrolase family protein [Aeromicrobium sp.]
MRIAIAQYPAIFDDLEGAVNRCAEHVEEAADAGADLVAFAETWLGGYPAWCFGASSWDDPLGSRLYGDLVRSSAVLGDGTDPLAPIRGAARDRGIVVVLGLNERAEPGSGSLFNSQLVIGADGEIVNHHRKITATSTEKNVWAAGDAAGLRVVETAAGRVGGLICWEHWNPLARQVLHAGHEEIHVASWPDLSDRHELVSRTYAVEGRCFVVVAASLLHRDDVPETMLDAFLHGLAVPEEDCGSTDHLFDGGSGVIGPDGEWIVGPVRGVAGLIVVDVDLDDLMASRFTADLAGHYQRADLFQLHVNSDRRSPSGVVAYTAEQVAVVPIEREGGVL